MYLLSLILTLLITPAQPANVTSLAETEDVIVDMATEAIQDKYNRQEFRFQISPRWIPGSLREISPENIQSVQLKGPVQKYTHFEVVYRDQDGPGKTEVQLKVEAEQKVPVTAHRKLSGEVLETEDLDWKWITVNLSRDKPITDLKELEGKTLRRTVNAGQYLSDDFISAGLLVEAGDKLGLTYRENGLQIVMRCEARQNGTQGEEIKIYCKETRNKYLGRITGPGEAEWLKTQ